MPINLSIKNVPDEVVQRLRQRAERRHRSLQGELLAIIEEAVRSERELSPAELLAEVRGLACTRRPTRPPSSGRTVTRIKVADLHLLPSKLKKIGPFLAAQELADVLPPPLIVVISNRDFGFDHIVISLHSAVDVVEKPGRRERLDV